MKRIKQVILFRKDLKMRKGKIAAQVAHASLAVFLNRSEPNPSQPYQRILHLTPDMKTWVESAFTKIVLSVDDEASLLKAHEIAESKGLPCSLIRDSGRTEFGGQPTYTTVAIGPADPEEIDLITGAEGQIATRLA